jgi:putative ABC transport system permease protein
MIGYYFRLAIESFRRTPGITALMVMAIAVGIGVCVMALTIFHAMGSNPIWWKSDQLYAVTMDNWSPDEPADTERPNLPPDQVTYKDAEALLRSDIPKNTAVMYRSAGVLSGDGLNGPIPATNFTVRITTGDFFKMFEVPFRYGSGWDRKADMTPEPLIVLSSETNDKLFGGENSVGRTVRWNDREFRIVGVLEDWQPMPKFYDVNNGPFEASEQVYIPWHWGETMEVFSGGNSNCWKAENLTSFKDFLASDCIWIQAWVELPAASDRDRMQAFLEAHVKNERRVGRFQRPDNNRLSDVEQWLKDQRVVQKDNRVLVGLAFAFLVVCLINTVGLLLAKFLNSASISGVRRALGASRRDLFLQHMVEVGVVAFAGAIIGLGVGALGLKGFRALYQLSVQFNMGGGLQALAHIDVASVAVAVVLAVLATFAAGIYPAWRIGRIEPGRYLKNQ